jgi:hypothetical protein
LEDKSLRSKKVTWLSKHDKQCGGLYGMLLLVRGMPVYLTNHVDRSDKNLLHGRSGILLGWELAAKEPMPPRNKDHFLSYLPKCVYVQFEDEKEGLKVLPAWSVAGLGSGVYAIRPKPEYWYLDAKAAYSHQKISRHQLPIAPDFGRTAYSMQGFTLPAGKIDLNLGVNADAVTAYVAMSRFKTANDLIILQPFDLQTFQQGVPGQPTLLLKYLSLDNKGDNHDDLGDIQANLPSEQAAKRHHSKENRAASVQKACEKRSHEDMTLVLHKNKANMTAASKQKRSRVPKKQVQCQTCGQRKHTDGFTKTQWKSHGSCRTCQARKREPWLGSPMAFEPDAQNESLEKSEY